MTDSMVLTDWMIVVLTAGIVVIAWESRRIAAA